VALLSLLSIFQSPLLFAETSQSTPEALFEEARASVASGELDRAIELFGQVLEKNPGHSPSHLNLGLIFLRKKKLDQAILSFEKALSSEPGIVEAHLLLGQAYAAKQDWEKAESSFRAAIALRPENATAHYFLGLLHVQRDAPEKAIPLFKKVLKLQKEGKELEEAKKRLEQFKKTAARLFKEAQAQLQKGALEQAKKALSVGLRFEPENPYALASLGDVARKTAQFEEAERYFKQALEIKEDFFAAGLSLGEVYEKQGDVAKAIAAYQGLLARIPDRQQREALLARGKLKQIGETPEIAKRVRLLLRAGRSFLSEGDLERARREFRVALVFLPEQVYALFNLGKIALLEGKHKEAVARFQEVIRIDPHHLGGRLGLAETYQQKGEADSAIEVYQKAAEAHPQDARPNFYLGRLLEKEERLKEALEAYRKVLALPQEEKTGKRKIAQARIDFYEKRFKIDFSNTFVTYDSNSERSQNPVSEVTSNTSLGLSYYLLKKDRLRIPLKLEISQHRFHRAQFYFLNENLSLFARQIKPPYTFRYGYTLGTGSIGGSTVQNEQAFLSHNYSGEIIKGDGFVGRSIYRLNFEDFKSDLNPIFDANRLSLSGSYFRNLEAMGYKQGLIGVNYVFFNNDVKANDQNNRSHSISLSYGQEILPKLSGGITWTTSYTRYRHLDSLSISRGQGRRRRNRLESLSLDLSYRAQPGLSFFTSYVREKNRSNLQSPARIERADLEAGQVDSLGSYSRELITFGATASSDLRLPYPRWSQLGKRLSVGLTTGYYRPSLKSFNNIIGDPKRVITQDPNHLLPSNPTFPSEIRNLRAGKIGGAMSLGLEAEWELSRRHGLVLSVLEWQNASVANDQVSLLLSPTVDPITVPRSARYNLAINQYFLSWRYSLFNDPGAGRLYLDLGLLGMSFTNLTMDALLKVEDNPVGDPFVSLGSSESRARNFVSRIGLGGSVFVKPWFSIGLNLSYLWGSAAALEVRREFRSDFRTIPEGLPGISDSPCFRLVDTVTDGETLATIGCESDIISPRGSAPRPLRLRLDGFQGELAFRFHFGEGQAGQTAFEKWLDWAPKDITEGPFAKRGLQTKKTSRLKIDGVLKNETAYRINEPVSFTKALTLFRLNSRYSFSPRYELTARFRAFYDAIYDLVDIDTISPRRFPNTVLTQLPQVPTPEEVASVGIENSRDVQITQSGLELREFFLDFHTKKLDLRIGKQIVRWGVVTGSRVTDEINPFDFSEFILREVQDRFIPLMMFKADYFPKNTHLELIWITEVVPHRPAPEGSEFEQFQILDGFVRPDSLLDSNLKLNLSAFKNTEVAGRMVRNINGLELGLTAFYTWDDFPSSFRAIKGGRGGGFQGTPDVIFAPRMKRITTLGTTLSKSFGRFVLNAEYAYTFDKFFGTLLAVGDANGTEPRLGELKRNFMKYAVGLDFPIFKIDFSLQLLQQYIPGWEPVILQDRFDTVGAVFMRKSFMNERLSVQMLSLYFINEADFLLRPRIETRMTDSIKTRFGADIFIGDRGERVGEFDFIGFFKDSNRVYVEAIYSF